MWTGQQVRKGKDRKGSELVERQMRGAGLFI
jgi:hypothetical protein